MRVYLPSTLVGMAQAVRAGEIGPAPITGYAVTPALREWYASGDQEELEYAAMAEAARQSLRMIAADWADGLDVPPRRAVLAAELSDDLVIAGAQLEDRARVRLRAAVPLMKIVAAHVDDAEATTDIRAAIAALPAADAGDDDARFDVDGAEAHELMWYASQEIRHLITRATR